MKLKELYESEEISVLTVMGQQPEKVSGNFYCHSNKLTSLEGGPKEVGGNFYCSYNQLTSLEGGPQEVGGDFNCYNNQLTGLLGFTKKVDGHFTCYTNQLTNLKDIHKHIKFIGAHANFQDNPIESHVVGLLLIEGLTAVYLDNKKVEEIINKHLKEGRDVLACIDELEEAGLSQFAKI